MPNQLYIGPDQALATQRHDLAGVVYLLSGTLKARAPGVTDTPFYWGTHNVSAPLGAGGAPVRFEAYLSRPLAIQRGLSFDPAGGPNTQAVRIPVYNYAFAHAETLVAAITDEDFSWENTEATLRVGYLKPGQSPGDLAAGDWTAVILDGFFGAPQDVLLDAFSVVLYSRGAKRNQALNQQVIPGPSTTAADSQGVDKRDVGYPYPIVVGRPDRWFRLPTTDMRCRGFTVSGYNAGDTTLQIRPLTSGINMLKTAGASNQTKIMVHYRTPVYDLTSGFADVQYDVDTDLLTFTLNSGLASDVPRGAYVQEYAAPDGYRWGLAAYQLLFEGISLSGSVGWRFSDGRIVPADPGRWPFEIDLVTGGDWDNVITTLRLDEGNVGNPNVPVFFDPLDPNSLTVTTQPAYTSTLSLSSKLNYGTGGTGAGNANARDGNPATAMSLALSEAKTITFNSAPAPFADDDTTASTLWVENGTGTITFTDAAGSTTFGVASGAGTFRFTQVAARDFNETVRCVGTTAGNVVEVYWEHDLTTQSSTTRTTDAAVGTGVSGTVGEAMQYAELVFRMPKDIRGNNILEKVTSTSGTLDANPWLDTENTGLTGQPVSWPAATLAGLQSLLLGDDGGLASINQASYTAAHARHQQEGIRFNFVIEEKLNSWTDLEQALASQVRTYMQYGPSGHEMVFQESLSGLETLAPLQEFRLEGVPGANAVAGVGPILERTPVSEIRNAIDVDYAPDLDGRSQRTLSLTDATSVALFGERHDPQGRFFFWAHSADPGNPNYDVAASVSGIVSYMLERYSFAHTRFRFRTAWIAYGVDRGSLVRVAFKVGPNSYRNVLCEVEDIRTNPPEAEKVDLVCRSVAGPQYGYTAAYYWLDVFDSGDTWTDQIPGEISRWDQHWTILPEE